MKDIIFESNNEYGVPTLLPSGTRRGVELPFSPWSVARKNVAKTIHFYIDDYRFTNLWRRPEVLIERNPAAIVELNYSLTEETPLALGLALLYKKRWLSRYYQMYDINVFCDLNVSPKWEELNKLGVPHGYNAFATRGSAQDIDGVSRALRIAREIRGGDDLTLIVYGGGRDVERECRVLNVIYIDDYMTAKRKENNLKNQQSWEADQAAAAAQ